MKKGSSLLLASVLLLAALAGCSTREDNSLVSKTPFPAFSEADTEGNQVCPQLTGQILLLPLLRIRQPED